MNILLGLDIDDTITANPPFFIGLAKRCLSSGGEVHVVSSRSQQALDKTKTELYALGLPYTALFLLPPMSEAQGLCPHAELDWYRRYLWLKVDYALRHRLTHFVDDDERVLALFAQFVPDVIALLPAEASIRLKD